MQILPFVFAIAMAFVFLVAHMNQEDRIDRLILKTLVQKSKARFKLAKAGERVLFSKLDKNKQSLDQISQKKPRVKKVAQYVCRPLIADGSYAKFSLACFLEPFDQTLRQFALDQVYQTLVYFYQDQITQELFYEILKQVALQEIETLCQLRFKDEHLQKQFFNLLAHPKYPLERFVCLDKFDKGALFYFNTLQQELFWALFQNSDVDQFFIQEKQLRIAQHKTMLDQKKLGPLLAQLAPSWSATQIDRLISFKEPDKRVYKAYGEHHEFFYYIKDGGVLPQK